MSFIAFSKSSTGFPIGKGDEVQRYQGQEFIITPCANQWRVLIFMAGFLVNTRRVSQLQAARGYALDYLDEELRRARR